MSSQLLTSVHVNFKTLITFEFESEVEILIYISVRHCNIFINF